MNGTVLLFRSIMEGSQNGMKPLNDGHRERLRNRYLQADGHFPDYDMLELLLTYAVQRRDVKPIARELVRQFKDLAGVLDADMEKLCQVDGIGEKSALLIRLLRDLCSRYLESKVQGTEVLSSSAELKDYARMKLAGYAEEVMMLVCLDVKNHVISTEIIARGTVDAAVVYPRNVAAAALNCSASGVIIIHNHPSGVTEPSRADRQFTRQVQDALRTLDIRLLDHLIVSRTSSYSFLDHGILERTYG